MFHILEGRAIEAFISHPAPIQTFCITSLISCKTLQNINLSTIIIIFKINSL